MCFDDEKQDECVIDLCFLFISFDTAVVTCSKQLGKWERKSTSLSKKHKQFFECLHLKQALFCDVTAINHSVLSSDKLRSKNEYELISMKHLPS
jgi:hypothetical protein